MEEALESPGAGETAVGALPASEVVFTQSCIKLKAINGFQVTAGSGSPFGPPCDSQKLKRRFCG